MLLEALGTFALTGGVVAIAIRDPGTPVISAFFDGAATGFVFALLGASSFRT